MTEREASIASQESIGTVLGGRYEVFRELGRGGMGVVFACLDRATGSRVALKRVARTGRTPEAFWFHQEARALASLDHPSIVRGRDFGILEDGSPYLVMDLVPGVSLQQLLEPKPLPWTLTWNLIDQVLSALAHAHGRGVVHGDLKPQNLIIEVGTRWSDIKVHVLDFGLAFLLRDRRDPRLESARDAPAPALPSGGGTPGFMAPEQIRRAVPHVGPPTDLYALGCILFQMLTGRPPFEALREGPKGWEHDDETILRLHKKAPVPVPMLQAAVPEEVAQLVVRMLAKKPWRRFEFAADLRNRWEAVRPTGRVPDRTTGDPTFEEDAMPFADTRMDLASDWIASETPVVSSPKTPELLGLRVPPLIGRAHERQELLRYMDVVVTGVVRHRMVLLTGEAGVGKSKIAEWICERAHETGKMIPLRARFRRVNGPLDGLNGAILAHYGLERVDRIMVEQALINVWEVAKDDEDGMTWVAATAEWLRPSSYRRTTEIEERRTRDRPALGPTGKRFALDEPEIRSLVIKRVLEKIGRERPILLWLDDLHHAPPSTADALAKIRRDSANLRMMIVATARDEALVADPAIERWMESLRHAFGGPRLDVQPLDRSDTHTLLRMSLPIDDFTIQEAESRSNGNPLFALQILHAWAAQGDLDLASGEYRVKAHALQRRATTTGDLWNERLSALDPNHRVVAETASALGAEFRADVFRALIAHVLGPDASFDDVVARLARAHILVATAEDRFRFPHALLQEHLLYRLATRDDAGKLFSAASAAMAIHPLSGTRRVVRHRVLNLLRAGEGDEAAKLLFEYIEQAWNSVRDASRTLEDLNMLDVRALDVAANTTSEGPISERMTPILPPLSPENNATLFRWRAEALRHAGRFEEAREAAARARRALVQIGDERQEAHCTRVLGHLAADIGDPVEGKRLVSRALTVFDRLGDDHGRALCEVVLGEIDYLQGDHVAARDFLHRGARRFKMLEESLGEAQCLLLLGLVELSESLLTKSRELLLEARREFEELGYRLGSTQCDIAIAHLDHRSGDFEAANARAVQTQKTLRTLENPRGLAAAERLLAMLAIDRDDPEGAARHSRDALDLYQKLGDAWGIAEARILLAQEALLRGELEEARSQIDACESMGISEAEPLQHLHLSRAWLFASSGFFRKAGAALEEAQAVFSDKRRLADHTPQLLMRFETLDFRDPAGRKVREWVRELSATTASIYPPPK